MVQRIGTLSLLLSVQQIQDTLSAGILKVFVSNHYIQEQYQDLMGALLDGKLNVQSIKTGI